MTSSSRYLSGAIGGMVGGFVYGIIVVYMGTLTTFGELVGSTAMATSWIVLLVLSVVVGLTYSWAFGTLSRNGGGATSYGLLHGLVWWVLGALILMPLALGAPVQVANALSREHLLSLIASLAYGVVLGFTYGALYFAPMPSSRHDRSHAHRPA